MTHVVDLNAKDGPLNIMPLNGCCSLEVVCCFVPNSENTNVQKHPVQKAPNDILCDFHTIKKDICCTKCAYKASRLHAPSN